MFLSRCIRLGSVFTIAVIFAGSSGVQDRVEDAWQDIAGCSDIVDVEIFIVEFPESRLVEEVRACPASLRGSGLDVSSVAGEATGPQVTMLEALEASLNLTLDHRTLVQHGLVSLGYDIRIVDEFFGSRTRQEIRGPPKGKGAVVYRIPDVRTVGSTNGNGASS